MNFGDYDNTRLHAYTLTHLQSHSPTDIRVTKTLKTKHEQSREAWTLSRIRSLYVAQCERRANGANGANGQPDLTTLTLPRSHAPTEINHAHSTLTPAEYLPSSE